MSRADSHEAQARGSWLFVSPWDIQQVGGVVTVVTNLAGECASAGPGQPLLLVASEEHATLAESTEKGLAVARFKIRSPVNRGHAIRSIGAFVLTLPSTLLTIVRFLRRRDVAVVNVHYPGLWALVFVLSRQLGLFRGRILLSIHGMDIYLAARTTGPVRLLWRLMFSHADAIIGCSSHLAQECRTAFPMVGSKLHVVKNGVDFRGIVRAAEEVRLPHNLSGLTYLLSVGHFESRKGHDVLLRAFARIASSHPSLHLVCAGRAGPTSTLAALQNMSRSLGLEARIHFLEDVTPDRVGAYYAGATLFVHPSRWEPFGIAILEAGVLRKPVVASRVGGIPEFLRNGENGLLVPPEDDSALADAIVMLLNDRDLATRLGEALYRDVHRNFSWGRAWQEYLVSAGMATVEREVWKGR